MCLKRSCLNGRWLNVVALLSLTAVLAVVMQCTQEYRFYAKEAEHLWLNDGLWIGQWLRRPGGVAQLLTSALTQFFGIWGVGALTMSVILTLIVRCGMGVLRGLQRPRLSALWLLPVTFLFICQEFGYYSLRGTVATLLAMLAAWLYTRRPSLVLSVLLTAAVCWTAGAAGVLLALLIVVAEALTRRNWASMAVAVLTAVLCAGVGVHYGCWISLEEALTPAQYYEWPSTYYVPLYAWASLVLVPVLVRVLGNGWLRTKAAVGVAVALATGTMLYQAVHNPKIYLLREDEWRTSKQDWDGIIAAHQGLTNPTPFMSYLNLALAEKGQLVERMGEFCPYIVWSDEAKMYSPVLMTQNELSRDALKLQSALCMAWGGEALCNAQKAAYEANFLTPGDTDPVELQRLVLTNHLLETPRVAQKYLRRLSRTTMHHAWADERLQNPALLDSETEALRPTLPVADSFYLKTQVGRMLRGIAMQTPQNRVAAQFYEAYLIQSQDSVAYRHWREYLSTLN